MHRCVVCRYPYYRRNMSIQWTKTGGKWHQQIAKGHPECLRILNRITTYFRKSA